MRGSLDLTDRFHDPILVTMISAVIIILFTMVEFIDYRRVHTDTSIIVDRSRGEKLNVIFNITFARVPCYCE